MNRDDYEKVIEWFLYGEVGSSSKAIVRVMFGEPRNLYLPTPSDMGDFKRCYKLISKFPHWKDKLNKMSEYSSRWEHIVNNWDELSHAYLNKDYTTFKNLLTDQKEG